jgi:hypothetical protein
LNTYVLSQNSTAVKLINNDGQISTSIWHDDLQVFCIYVGHRYHNFARCEFYNSWGYFITANHQIIHDLRFKYQIVPRRISEKSRICNIGYSEKHRCWVSWRQDQIRTFQPNQTLKYRDWFDLICAMGFKPADYEILDDTAAKALAIRHSELYSKY